MKKTVQVKYADFSEIFDVDLFKGNIDIELKNVIYENADYADILTLDLKSEVKKDYDVFSFETGDLLLIQIKNIFIVNYVTDTKKYWVKFDSSQVLSYLFRTDILDHLLPFIDEDKDLFLNSVLSDFIRNDYSYSLFNKKIKYVKVSILSKMISELFKFDFSRFIFDETILGDVDIADIIMSLRFADKKIISACKIDSLAKIMTLLEKEKVIDTKFRFINSNYLINSFGNAHKTVIRFSNTKNQYEYDLNPGENYIFDLGNIDYEMQIPHDNLQRIVRGKVSLFNGDERDLMIK